MPALVFAGEQVLAQRLPQLSIARAILAEAVRLAENLAASSGEETLYAVIRHPGGPAVILASAPISRLAREIVPRKSRRSSRNDPSTSEPFSFGHALPAGSGSHNL